MTSVQNHQRLLSGNRTILGVLLLIFSLNFSFAQSKKEFQKKYAASKDFYNSGNYAQAYEGFRLLTQKHNNNAFEQYAHYYTGASALKVGKLLDAKFILVNAIKKFPEWKQLYEVKYVLAQVAFQELDYARGFGLCSEIIHEKKIQEDVVKLVRSQVFNGSDLNVFLNEQLKYPESYTLAKAIADRIRYTGGGLAEKMLLQYFIQEYGLNPDSYNGVFARTSVKKPEYNIAVLLPYKIGDKMNWGKSGKVIEMYEALQLAVEGLEKETSSKFKLYTYDTQKDTSRIKELLALPEFAQMDLIVGAYANQSSELVKQYAEARQIHYVNPLNGDPVLIGTYSKLFKPSYYEIGKELAVAAVDSFPPRPDVCVFYGDNKRDSLIADSYKTTLENLGKNVAVYQKVGRYDASIMSQKINKLNLDSTAHIAIFNKQDLVATNFMSALESRISSMEAAERKAAEEADEPCECIPKYVPVVAPIDWINVHIIQFEQFMRRAVHFYNVDYINYQDEEVKAFRLKMKDRMGVVPSTNYAAIGYDLMYVYGPLLDKYGNSFVNELATEGLMKAVNYGGVDYSNGVSNAVVPLLRLNEDYHLETLNSK